MRKYHGWIAIVILFALFAELPDPTTAFIRARAPVSSDLANTPFDLLQDTQSHYSTKLEAFSLTDDLQDAKVSLGLVAEFHFSSAATPQPVPHDPIDLNFIAPDYILLYRMSDS